ncbi:Uncharacterised protein [Acinetobacter baumannii]|nr:Uncharacterised protein [Acinetobacter baumannii]
MKFEDVKVGQVFSVMDESRDKYLYKAMAVFKNGTTGKILMMEYEPGDTMSNTGAELKWPFEVYASVLNGPNPSTPGTGPGKPSNFKMVVNTIEEKEALMATFEWAAEFIDQAINTFPFYGEFSPVPTDLKTIEAFNACDRLECVISNGRIAPNNDPQVGFIRIGKDAIRTDEI